MPLLRRLSSLSRAWLPVMIVAAIALGITAVAYVIVDRAEERDVANAFKFRAEWRAKDFQAKINLAGQAMLATATDVNTEPRVESEEFHQFTSAVAAANKSIEALSWAQPVTRGQRAAFEAGAGVPIVELGTDGRRIPAAERDGYTPIVMENRFDGQPQWVGFDMSMDPIRRQALDMARDTNQPTSMMVPHATNPVGPTYLIFWPTS